MPSAFIRERDLFRANANLWCAQGRHEGFIPYVERYKRIELFLELGLSLGEVTPELYEVMEQAKRMLGVKDD